MTLEIEKEYPMRLEAKHDIKDVEARKALTEGWQKRWAEWKPAMTREEWDRLSEEEKWKSDEALAVLYDTQESKMFCVEGCRYYEILAMDEDPYIREQVAWFADTPHYILGHLMHDPDADVRISVCQSDCSWNWPLPEDMVRELAADESPEVRAALAEYVYNHQYEGIAELLSKDPDREVRRGLLLGGEEVRYASEYMSHHMWEEHVLPLSVLDFMAANDEDKFVREHAKDLADTKRTSDEARRVASDPNSSVSALELLLGDKVLARALNLEESIADNPSCPAHFLELFAKDEDRDLRRHVAKRPSCPVHLLELLAEDKSDWIRKVVAENPNCPEKLRISLGQA